MDDGHSAEVGSAAAINEALQDLRYRGKDGHEGWDEVKVSLSDSPLDVCASKAAASSLFFAQAKGGGPKPQRWKQHAGISHRHFRKRPQQQQQQQQRCFFSFFRLRL